MPKYTIDVKITIDTNLDVVHAMVSDFKYALGCESPGDELEIVVVDENNIEVSRHMEIYE